MWNPRSSIGCTRERCSFPPTRRIPTLLNFPGSPWETRVPSTKLQGHHCSLFGQSRKTGLPDTWFIAVPGTTISSVSVSILFALRSWDIGRRLPGKDTSGQRLTYLLRPNVRHPSSGVTSLDTPPATDFGYSSHGDLEDESDIILSDHELASSTDSLPPLPGLSLALGIQTRAGDRPSRVDSDADWSVIGDDLEADAELSGNEGGERGSGPVVDTIPEEPGSNGSPTEDVRFTRRTPFSRVWDLRPRNSSSPSRSPARRCPSRRAATRQGPFQDLAVKSFYMYLFGDL